MLQLITNGLGDPYSIIVACSEVSEGLVDFIALRQIVRLTAQGTTLPKFDWRQMFEDSPANPRESDIATMVKVLACISFDEWSNCK